MLIDVNKFGAFAGQGPMDSGSMRGGPSNRGSGGVSDKKFNN